MEQIDLTTFAGIAAATTLLIGLLKQFAIEWVKGRERLLSLVIAVLLAIISKATDIGFSDVSWINLVITGLGGGISAGLIHDGIVNPLKNPVPPPEKKTSDSP